MTKVGNPFDFWLPAVIQEKLFPSIGKSTPHLK